MIPKQYDLAIIGAGAAGMGAAIAAAQRKLKVIVLDEQPSPGGQIYRAIKHPPITDERILGADYYAGRPLLADFEQSDIRYINNAMVWSISEANQIAFSTNHSSECIQARKIIIATGAQERPMPFKGWTLPGVMTCGAAQILLKTSALTPAQPIVIAGNGPLLLLVAVQLMQAGITIEAILDTSEASHIKSAIPHFASALKNPSLLAKGLKLLKKVKFSGIKTYRRVTEMEATEDSSGLLNGVNILSNGKRHQLSCKTLLIHQGVIPNIQLSRALNLEHEWDTLQHCWRPVVDSWGMSSNEDIYIAGDGAGIAGAIAARLRGKLCALKIAELLQADHATHAKEIQATQTELHKQLAIRPFLDALYQPSRHFLSPSDDTLVCRCEEISAGEIRKIAKAGCEGPNQAKAFCRAGMGPCQGRMCGLTISHLMAETLNKTEAEVGYYNLRMPIKPLTLNELANLQE